MIRRAAGRVVRVPRRIFHALKASPTTARSAWRGLCYRAAGSGIPLRTSDRRLARLRGREQGKRIFILGNGPSLNRTDVDKLVGEVSIASNAIFLLFDRKRYRPTYYTIEDYLVAEDRRKEAAALTGAWKLFPADVRHHIPVDDRTMYVNFVRDYEGYP